MSDKPLKHPPAGLIPALLLASLAIIWCSAPLADRFIAQRHRIALGGDIEAIQGGQAIPFDVSAYMLFSSERISRTVETAAIAHAGKLHATVRLKGIDAAYPLYGEFKLIGDGKKGEVFFNAPKYNIHGAAIDERAAKALALDLGDIFTIEHTRFKVNAIIVQEPDTPLKRFALLPTIIVNNSAFAATGIAEGSDNGVVFRCRARLEDNVNITKFLAHADTLFTDPTWTFKDVARVE